MKLKVLRPYFDGEDHYVGDVVEVSDERGKQLLADDRKLVEVVKPKKEEKKK